MSSRVLPIRVAPLLLLAGLVLPCTRASESGQAGEPSEPEVVYRRVAGEELRLDTLLPPGAGPHPAVLLLHGGGWTRGSRRDVAALARLLVADGYAAFSADYRLAPAHPFPAQLEDCVLALQFLRANSDRFRIDPARIGVLGLSAGANLAALLGVLDERARPESPDPVLRQSSRARCVVSFFGPMLLTPTRTLDFDTRAPAAVLGESPEEACRAASPLLHASADDAPFLLVHGTADPLVPFEHSRRMHEALRALGVESELVPVTGAGHGDFLRAQPEGEPWARVRSFLARHLRTATKAVDGGAR